MARVRTVLLAVASALALSVADANLAGVTVRAQKTDPALFGSADLAVIDLEAGNNPFAWSVFNDGEDDLTVLRVRATVTGEGGRYAVFSKEYKDTVVRRAEEVSMPFDLPLKPADFPRLGNIVIHLDLRGSNGASFSREALSRRVRFPDSSDWGAAIVTVVGSVLFLLVCAYIYANVMYGTEAVGKFLKRGGDLSALKRKRN